MRVETNLGKGSALIFTSLSVGGALSLLTSIIIARSVGVTAFGHYSILISINGIVVIFAGFGIGWTLAKFVSQYHDREVSESIAFAQMGLLVVLVASSLSIAVYISISHFVGFEMYHEEEIATLIPIASVVVLGSALFSTVQGIIQGLQRIRALASLQLLNSSTSVLAVLLLSPSLGIGGALIGLATSQILSFTIGLLWLRRLGYSTRRILSNVDRLRVRRLLAYASPAVLSSSLVIPMYWIGNTQLVFTSGFEALGLFAVSFVFFQALSILPQSVSVPLMPRVSQLSARSEDELASIATTTLKRSTALCFPVFFGIGLFSREIVSFLYGSAYSAAEVSCYLMTMASYYFGIFLIASAIMGGHGKVWLILGLNAVWAALFACSLLLITPIWGPVGLAASFVGSYVVLAIGAIHYVHRIFRTPQTRSYINLALSGSLYTLGYLLLIGLLEVPPLGKTAVLGFATLLMLSLAWRRHPPILS